MASKRQSKNKSGWQWLVTNHSSISCLDTKCLATEAFVGNLMLRYVPSPLWGKSWLQEKQSVITPGHECRELIWVQLEYWIVIFYCRMWPLVLSTIERGWVVHPFLHQTCGSVGGWVQNSVQRLPASSLLHISSWCTISTTHSNTGNQEYLLSAKKVSNFIVPIVSVEYAWRWGTHVVFPLYVCIWNFRNEWSPFWNMVL